MLGEAGLLVLAWSLTFACFVIGLVGTIVPGLPGHLMIIAGALLHWLVLGDNSGLGWLSFVGLPLLFGLGLLADWFASSVGVKAKGGSRMAMLAAFIGGIFGLLFGSALIPIPLLGTVLGLMLGASVAVYLMEWLWLRKAERDARRVALGAAYGAALGMVSGLMIAFLMIGVFLADRFF